MCQDNELTVPVEVDDLGTYNYFDTMIIVIGWIN